MDLSGLRFDEGHTWVRDEGKEIVVGITDYAQEQLGDIVFIELPGAGERVERSDAFGSVESAKAVEDLISPVSGEVVRRNDDAMEAPESINDDPYGEGWMMAVKPDEDTDLSKLLSWEKYQEHLEVADSDETDGDVDDLDNDELGDDLFFDDE